MFEAEEMEGCHSCKYGENFDTEKEPCKHCYGLSMYTKKEEQIELVVKIPREVYKKAKETHDVMCDSVWLGIKYGTPLPKGHGRILDEKDILDTENNDGGFYDLVDMPEYIAGVKAILEADTITVGVKHDVLTKDDIKDVDPKDDIFVDAAESLKQTIALVREDQDKFIFECITPFLAEINHIVIPKRVLERALFTFKEEHTAEWKVLMKEYGGTV